MGLKNNLRNSVYRREVLQKLCRRVCALCVVCSLSVPSSVHPACSAGCGAKAIAHWVFLLVVEAELVNDALLLDSFVKLHHPRAPCALLMAGKSGLVLAPLDTTPFRSLLKSTYVLSRWPRC